MILVQAEPLDPAVLTARFIRGRTDVGALVSMTGFVRDATDGFPVDGLELDAYPGFTEQAVEAMAQDALRRFGLIDVLAAHRYGAIRPGEAIVLVAAAAVHRRQAFQGADYLMDRLKTEAPFWKKERGPDGERWIEPRPADHDDARRWTRPLAGDVRSS